MIVVSSTVIISKRYYLTIQLRICVRQILPIRIGITKVINIILCGI